MGALYEMDYIVCFLTLNPLYAQNSGGTYTTYYELNYAFEHKKKIVPLIIDDISWPPNELVTALHGVGDEGAPLVSMALLPSLVAFWGKGPDWPMLRAEDDEDIVAKELAMKIAQGVA